MSRRAADPAVTSAQLLASITALVGSTAANDRFAVAVSGGPDSLALLLLAAEALPGRVAAVTFDHQLRAESADEAALVARYCAELGIAHTTLTPDAPITGSVQDGARTARYAALERWRAQQGIDWIMTGHHADDQLETMVMRLRRGSGIAGLSGIRARHDHILRPLLTVRRAQLVAIVTAAALEPVDDPSNRDMRFDRARIRAGLSAIDWIDPVAAATSASALDQANQAIEWSVDRIATTHSVQDGETITLNTADVPEEICRRLLLRALATLDPGREPPRGEALSRALSVVRDGAQTMLGDCIIRPGPDAPGTLLVSRAPPRTQA